MIKRNGLENKNISHEENLTEKTNEKIEKLNNIQQTRENFSKTTNGMDIILAKFDELKK
ncbi:hypothetical protein [Clostridium botulinum]|uniref:hypothetical protein n=1 Tax=Clostridium botulinum TaxID=1491 RepID=UPI000AC8586F|nr:hypothetical protein [Clostridium botulinum]